MNANLLIKGVPNQSLDAFVGTLNDRIGSTGWEERQSSNYLGERYFRTFVLGVEVTVALADDDEFAGFPFWLCFEPEPGCQGEPEFLEGLADCVARKLAQQGHEVVRRRGSTLDT